MQITRKTALAASVALTTLTAAMPAAATDITLYRFFGDCEGEFGGVTDLNEAYGECGIITVLTNKFNAENEIGANVITQTVDWGAYYDLLSATYSTGDMPDVAVMHASQLVNFTDRNLMTPLGNKLMEAGVDVDDWADAARNNVTNNGEIYALPFDIHAILFHVNVGLMKEAGFVNEDGSVRLPSSPEELILMGKEFEEKTGQNYIAIESQSSEGMAVRMFDAFVWQQGGDVLSADGKEATIDSPEGLNAATLIKQMYDEGLTDSGLDYGGAEQAFIGGRAGILVNGTWGVNNYATQAENGAELQEYTALDFPTLYEQPATFSNSHSWTIPMDESRTPEEEEAAIAFLKFLDDNNFAWAMTGHLPVHTSVIESEEFAALPHRSDFAATPSMARGIPAVKNERGIYDAMISEFTAMWLAGTSPEDAVAGMQSGVERILRRNNR
ncbi:extracellular solute-binding protein [Marivivens donghaensis]|uniref:Extracellular solute-binding protein n=1 Tax=Marivivens donghaensis TaxID=1699413 RepID=A0ABX0VXC5_9RHOB|nr:extracellular solute-binding protein [Marivivens donghaensis]NIY71926.1 extracellular solute-binding protein [Marivivens donghaensis]